MSSHRCWLRWICLAVVKLSKSLTSEIRLLKSVFCLQENESRLQVIIFIFYFSPLCHEHLNTGILFDISERSWPDDPRHRQTAPTLWNTSFKVNVHLLRCELCGTAPPTSPHGVPPNRCRPALPPEVKGHRSWWWVCLGRDTTAAEQTM